MAKPSAEKWEVVTKKKKASNGPEKKQPKKQIQNNTIPEKKAPVEDGSSVFSKYREHLERKEQKKQKSHDQKENKTPVNSPKKHKSPKQEKSSANGGVPNKQSTPLKKNQPPKSLDSALNQLQTTDVTLMVASLRQKFPNMPSLWLKDVASFMSCKLNVPDCHPACFNKPYNFPLNMVTDTILIKCVTDVIEECSPAALELVFEYCIQEMLADKKLAASYGYRIMIQLIAKKAPTLIKSQLHTKYSDMLSQYQSNNDKYLTVFWSISQFLYQSFNSGLQVWLTLLLPMLSSSECDLFSITFLDNLFKHHERHLPVKDVINHTQFFSVFDKVHPSSSVNNLQPSIHRKLLSLYPKIKKLAFTNRPETNLRYFYPTFLDRYHKSAPEGLKIELTQCLEQCLSVDQTCHHAWIQLYPTRLQQSTNLLHHLHANWTRMSRKLGVDKTRDTVVRLNEAHVSNKVKLSANYKAASHACQDILDLYKEPPYPWYRLVYVCVLVVILLLTADIFIHGGIQQSMGYTKLYNTGVIHRLTHITELSVEYSTHAYRWIADNSPLYIQQLYTTSKPYVIHTFTVIETYSVHLYNTSHPYILHTYTVCKPYVLHTYTVCSGYMKHIYTASLPAIHTLIDYTHPYRVYMYENIPVWYDRCQVQIEPVVSSVCQTVLTLYTSAIYYIMMCWAYILELTLIAVTWLQANVFKGNFSGENVQQRLVSMWHLLQEYSTAVRDWLITATGSTNQQ